MGIKQRPNKKDSIGNLTNGQVYSRDRTIKCVKKICFLKLSVPLSKLIIRNEYQNENDLSKCENKRMQCH